MKSDMKRRSRNLKHRQNFSFVKGNTVAVPVQPHQTSPVKVKPVKQNPRIINVPKLCYELNKVVPGRAQLTGNGILINKIEVKIAEGRAEYGPTILRFTAFRGLLDNLLLDKVIFLTSQQKQYLITGYNRKKKNKPHVLRHDL